MWKYIYLIKFVTINQNFPSVNYLNINILFSKFMIKEPYKKVYNYKFDRSLDFLGFTIFARNLIL